MPIRTSKKANSAVGRWQHKRPFGKRMSNKATRQLGKIEIVETHNGPRRARHSLIPAPHEPEKDLK